MAVHVHFDCACAAGPDALERLTTQNAAILVALNTLINQGKVLLMDENLVKAALQKIDNTTNQIAKNVDAEATALTTVAASVDEIGTDVDNLQKALAAALANGAGVSQELVDQANALSAKADASSAALEATAGRLTDLVPVLHSIATKGISNVTPLPVPPPPDPIVPAPGPLNPGDLPVA